MGLLVKRLLGKAHKKGMISAWEINRGEGNSSFAGAKCLFNFMIIQKTSL